MIVDFTVYNAAGKILRTGSCPGGMESLQYNAGAGEQLIVTRTLIEEEKIDTSVPASPVVVVRAPSPITLNKSTFSADGTDGATFSSVPAGAMVNISMPTNTGLEDIYGTVVNDGALTITTTVKGIYEVEFRHDDYLIYTVSLHAN